ncbi:MAG TPA: PIG-L family deacetylase [Cyanothece sp. UBA12306]|nr:PIG-L family deacetylase [Cyanothece sp. UBA12306]
MSNDTLRMLVIAPHPDDEILGVGGTMSRFASKGGEVTVLTVAAHMPPLYTEEIHQQTVAEAHKAHKLVGVKESIFLDKPAVLLSQIPVPEFNQSIFEVVRKIKPDILLIPYYDRHIDHRLIFDAAMVAGRPVGIGKNIKVLAAYETLSETHWNAPHLEPNFTPNWCVDITDYIDTKIEAMQCYESQLHSYPMPRSLEALKALALFRGSQAGMGYAEGFHLLRMTMAPEALF